MAGLATSNAARFINPVITPDALLEILTRQQASRCFLLQRGAGQWLWREQQLLDSIDQHSCYWLVEDDQECGYCVLQFPADDICEILNLVIFKRSQRRGFGKLMIDQIVTLCREETRSEIWLEVRHSNAIAKRLYLSAGFDETGLRKQYYPTGNNSREDGVSMSLHLQ